MIRDLLRAAVPALLLASLSACGGGGDTWKGAPVILISVDTLRSDHLPAYGYKGVETPAIDALRADSILFERAYSHTPLTLPSHSSMLSGLLPTRHLVRDNAGYTFDAGKHPSVPELLAETGYETGAAVSSFVLRKEAGLAAAFGHYDDSEPNADTEQRAGDLTVQRALEWVRGRAGRPFFLFVHLYEPHTPYEPPEPFASRYAESPYDGEVAAADAAVGRLVEELKKLGVYDRAVVVFLSDHGEGLGDHDELEHGLFLYRETLQVPLLLKLPGSRRAGASIAAPAQLADVAPTLLELAGVDAPEGLDGRSLLALDDGKAAPRRIYAETFYPRIHYGWSELASLIEGPFHYIHGSAPELFDLAADPGERRNVLERERRVYAGMRQAIDAYDRELAAPDHVDAETAKKLAALGYAASPRRDTGGLLPDPRTKRHVLRDMQAAKRAVSESRYEEGAEMMRRALRDTPDMLDAWVFIGLCMDRLERPQEALAAYQKALEVSGGSPEYALKVGEQLYKLGRLDEAREHAELALEANPSGANGLLAGVALSRRDVDSALDLLRRGAAVSEKFRRDLGLALSESGRGAEALEVLQPAAEGGTDPATANALAVALSESGRHAEAAAVVERVIAADPKNARAHEIHGMVSLRLRRPQEARAHLEQALALNRRLPNAWNTLGVALYDLEGPEAALSAWQQAVALDPTQYEALLNIGLVAAQTGRRGEARQALRRFVDTAPPRRFGPDIQKAQQLLREIGG
ncbi:MAG TPA: sulfatase-like hydrolase/transferase [Thermoanaerobaculia bacterium]